MVIPDLRDLYPNRLRALIDLFSESIGDFYVPNADVLAEGDEHEFEFVEDA